MIGCVWFEARIAGCDGEGQGEREMTKVHGLSIEASIMACQEATMNAAVQQQSAPDVEDVQLVKLKNLMMKTAGIWQKYDDIDEKERATTVKRKATFFMKTSMPSLQHRFKTSYLAVWKRDSPYSAEYNAELQVRVFST